MNQQELLADIQGKYWCKELVGSPTLVETKPNGDKWYVQNILEVAGNVATYRNIAYYVLNEGTENEEAYYNTLPLPSLVRTDSDVIKHEVLSDPLGVGYANMTAEERISSLNTQNRPYPGNTRFITARTVLNEVDTTLAIELIAVLETVSQSNPVIKLAWDMLQTYSDGGGLDLYSGPVDVILGQLLSQGALREAHVTAIQQMRYTTRAKELIGRAATVADIS